MKLHAIDSVITNIGIEILKKKLLNPNESIKSIAKGFNISKSDQDAALMSAQHHLGIKMRSYPAPNIKLPYINVVEVDPQPVTFGDIPMMYLAPEPEWMKSVDLNDLPPTNDEKAILYMNSKF